MAILGLDIGGANIKAADETGFAISSPFAIWQKPDELSQEIACILSQFPKTDLVALTMTAELADCFTTKSEGVRFILDAVEARLARETFRRASSSLSAKLPLSRNTGKRIDFAARRPRPPGRRRRPEILVWLVDGGAVCFFTRRPRSIASKIAAANWHALSTWCGQFAIPHRFGPGYRHRDHYDGHHPVAQR